MGVRRTFAVGTVSDVAIRKISQGEALYEPNTNGARKSLMQAMGIEASGPHRGSEAAKSGAKAKKCPCEHARGMVQQSEDLMIEVQEREGTVSFPVQVRPWAKRDAIEGEYQGALRVRVTAPPVDDRANDALRRLLGKRLKVPISALRIIGGQKSPRKRIEIAGVTREEVLALAR